MSLNSFSNGMISEMPGNIDVEMTTPSTTFLNRKFSRASAYAVSVPTSSVINVVSPATTRLFSSARPKPTPGLKTAVKFFTDQGAGSTELSNWSSGRRKAETNIQ